MKQLTKSKRNRMIVGVCGGLAEYFNVDATLVRIGFVLLGMSGAFGIVLYVVLAIIMPEPANGQSKKNASNRKRN